MAQSAGENVLKGGLRFLLGAGAAFLFCFTLALAASQNPSAAQARPAQSNGPLAEAQASLARGNSEDAIRILSDHLQTHPADTAARTLLGQAYALSLIHI